MDDMLRARRSLPWASRCPERKTGQVVMGRSRRQTSAHLSKAIKECRPRRHHVLTFGDFPKQAKTWRRSVATATPDSRHAQGLRQGGWRKIFCILALILEVTRPEQGLAW
jgi:hypothetical protein